ncbi:hypothetical protein GLOTRDRAFT_118670 [Gloeophyllum trabeum ATCC 11539]|uniref:Uncharacterized protein n=1 Tax=Gloeophyllum trabeum (strain ATCC 11539 / FP-39264 / Madison 617) TaxID=670483 RepID=S7QLQ9_GLOTA|nr:uncharacterized protein GLOTRDRAFT_118670 [Gloeophyllum trabeum ATCC 11539]EPQ60373.1 hypothetical protein GLOTRDRAFT_118670 [Gloeophyllum trabeum ATCC 11539]
MVVLKRSDEPDLNDILVLPHASGPERRGMATYWFHLPDLIHHDEVFNQSANPPSEDFKEAYALTKAELTLQITEYAPMLRKYTAAMKKRRQQQIRTAKNKRRADICQRLRQGEFEEDIDVLTTSPHRKDWQLFSRHPLVDSTEELTHEGWDSIKSGIFQFMQDYRTRRLLVQYKHTLIHRFEVVRTAADDQRRKHDGIRPHFVDFCLLPQVRALLDIPRDKNVDQRALDQLFKTYPILAEDWRTIATNQLRAHARRQMALPLNEDQDPLKLAVAYFKCTKCNVVVLYPAALEHSCCWRWPENENSESERDVLVEPVYDDAARVAAGEYPWSCQRLEWCPWADKIEKVFQVCGLNPMATTLSRAQDLDHRVKLT